MLRYDALSSLTSAESRTVLSRQRVQIKKALDALLRRPTDTNEYDVSLWRTCSDFELLEASGMRERVMENLSGARCTKDLAMIEGVAISI